jgi:FkbM family methyltransferase
MYSLSDMARIKSNDQYPPSAKAIAMTSEKKMISDKSESTLSDKLEEYLKESNGFYIECGANDGLFQTNTLFLEHRGWSGLLIEPSPNAFEDLILNRSPITNYFENCALVRSNKMLFVYGDFDGHPMSSVNSVRRGTETKLKIEAKTLQTILNCRNITKVDFFSLDVEGYELEVLKGLDFSLNPPGWLLIEIYRKDFKKINRFLKFRGYHLITNLSNYSKETHPLWDGSHNDYLFKFKGNLYSKLINFFLKIQRRFQG